MQTWAVVLRMCTGTNSWSNWRHRSAKNALGMKRSDAISQTVNARHSSFFQSLYVVVLRKIETGFSEKNKPKQISKRQGNKN